MMKKNYRLKNCHLYLGDCLDVMPRLTATVGMVMTDPPYGTTACKWDSVIPLDEMWSCLNALTKVNAAMVMMASQPFTTALISSNIKAFKYCWVWKKNKITGFMQAKTKPLNSFEDICIFGEFKVAAQYFNGVYNPQGVTEDFKITEYSNKRKPDHITGNRKRGVALSKTNYPKNIIDINSENKTVHPTQKPVALMEYLIKTYTNEGDTVLDFAMGSGTTGVACVKLNRKFIGIELDTKYFQIAYDRIKNTEHAK